MFSLTLPPILLPQLQEAKPEKPMPPETNPAGQTEQPPKAGDAESAAQPDSEASEVDIPSVGRILVRADAHGYDEEVQRRVQDCAECHCSSVAFPCGPVYSFKVFGNSSW